VAAKENMSAEVLYGSWRCTSGAMYIGEPW
jgi:hypothetical protein